MGELQHTSGDCLVSCVLPGGDSWASCNTHQETVLSLSVTWR